MLPRLGNEATINPAFNDFRVPWQDGSGELCTGELWDQCLAMQSFEGCIDPEILIEEIRRNTRGQLALEPVAAEAGGAQLAAIN